ncbi:hypothetical protein [Vibrio sp. HI00D65]
MNPECSHTLVMNFSFSHTLALQLKRLLN